MTVLLMNDSDDVSTSIIVTSMGNHQLWKSQRCFYLIELNLVFMVTVVVRVRYSGNPKFPKAKVYYFENLCTSFTFM